jgi:hypothetical protein
MTAPNLCTLEQARAAKPRVVAVFKRLAPVVGVGITQMNGGYAVKVNLQAAPPQGTPLPESVDGVPVRVEVVGTIRAL